jgi:hypothetical protein
VNEDVQGTKPTDASPAATPTRFCSAIPSWKNWSGRAAANLSAWQTLKAARSHGDDVVAAFVALDVVVESEPLLRTRPTPPPVGALRLMRCWSHVSPPPLPVQPVASHVPHAVLSVTPGPTWVSRAPR